MAFLITATDYQMIVCFHVHFNNCRIPPPPPLLHFIAILSVKSKTETEDLRLSAVFGLKRRPTEITLISLPHKFRCHRSARQT